MFIDAKAERLQRRLEASESDNRRLRAALEVAGGPQPDEMVRLEQTIDVQEQSIVEQRAAASAAAARISELVAENDQLRGLLIHS